MKEIFGGLIKFLIDFLRNSLWLIKLAILATKWNFARCLILLLLIGCTPKPPPHPAANWCYKMCMSEQLGLDECSDDKIVFLSFRKVGIGEARRHIVRMVRTLEKEGLCPSTIRIMFKETNKKNELKYVRGFIAEVVYCDNQIFYAMMGNILQQVQREDYDEAVDRALGYPAPIDPVDPPKE